MMALGDIQAQSCHTGKYPTSVTTQDPVRQQALVVPTRPSACAASAAARCMRCEELVRAAGLCPPARVNAHHIVRRLTDTEVRLLSSLIMRVEPGALLGSLEKQNTVFSYILAAGQRAQFSRHTTPSCRRRPGRTVPMAVQAAWPGPLQSEECECDGSTNSPGRFRRLR